MKAIAHPFIISIATSVMMLALAACSSAPMKPIPPVNASSEGVAIHGYDPVAYFTEGQPTEGREAISASWRGATWRFANEQNHALFLANPQKYAPQYGGYCAYAVAVNQVADIDPHQWAIVDDQLYLNANELAQILWDADRTGNIESANENWRQFPVTPAAPLGEG